MIDRSRASARGLVLAAALAGCTGPAGPTEEVEPGPEVTPAGYALTIRGGDQRLADPAQPVWISIDIVRVEGGYDGPITFAAEAPEGIVIAFRPETVLRDFTRVILVADARVEARDHQIIFRGTAPGRADQVVSFTLSIRPAS